MTEQINDQISAFIDDELPEEESAFLLRRFERDPGARNQALRYTMIGSALRNDASETEQLLNRVSGAVSTTLRERTGEVEQALTQASATVGSSLKQDAADVETTHKSW